MDQNHFEALLNQILQQDKVWLLQATDGLFAMLETDDRISYLPLWASESLAASAIQDEWEAYQLAEMDVAELITWLNELTEDAMKIGIVFDEFQRIYPLSAEEFQQILIKERKSK